jgi:hypothetical protein
MTKEQRTFIAPSDIVAIECECPHCQTRYSVPLSKFDRALHQCPNCKEGLATVTNVQCTKIGDDTLLHQFVEAMKDLSKLTIKLRLEIKNDS